MSVEHLVGYPFDHMGQEIPYLVTRLAVHGPVFMGCSLPTLSCCVVPCVCNNRFLHILLFFHIFHEFFSYVKPLGKHFLKSGLYYKPSCHFDHFITSSWSPQNHSSPCTVNRWRNWRKHLVWPCFTSCCLFSLLFLKGYKFEKKPRWGFLRSSIPPVLSLHFFWC